MPFALVFVKNFDEIALSRTVKEISKFVFFHFWQKFENSKWSPYVGRGKIFENCQEYTAQIPCESKISTKSLYLARVKEIEANLCFSIFGKNSKIQNGCHFWGEEHFLKIANSTLLRYLVGRKFRRNRSISHG